MSKLEQQPLVGEYRDYSTYSNSGVDWMGEMPAVWTLKRVKHMFTIRKRIAGELGYDILSVTQRGIVVKDIESGEGQLSMDYSKYQRVKPGDFAMNHMDLLTGYVDISDYDGVTSPDYRVFTLDNTDYSAKYFLYIFQMGYQLRLFFHMGQGASHLGRWRLATDEFNEMVFPVPSFEEQHTIAAFLDYETARIDQLIAKQQRLIELLKEKRQAVISHAVTKGLNPDAPMKDSGIEWLGQVPKHWQLTKLKWVAQTTSGSTPNTSEPEKYYDDGEYPWVRTTDLNNGTLIDAPVKITERAIKDTACTLLPIGSVLISMYGGAGSIGKHALLKTLATTNQAVCAVLPNSRLLPEYLNLFAEYYRPFWMASAEGTRKDPNIGQDHIREMFIPVPPLDEQRKVEIYVSGQLCLYDKGQDIAFRQVELLKERRIALISAAVTGKIDLRGWTPPAEEAAA